MVRSQCLKPINKILWVVKSGVETIDAEQICIERVGEKAFPQITEKSFNEWRHQ